MKKLLLLLLFLPVLASAQDRDIVLRIDTQGHRGRITDLASTNDGRYVISSAHDKSIRVWDIQERKEVRQFYGYIGFGDVGKTYAIALSPDDRFLAAAGCYGDPESELRGSIRIFDFETGKIVKTLYSHTERIFTLDFSDDGKYLVSGGEDFNVCIWDAQNDFKITGSYKEHSGEIYDMKIFRKDCDYRIVTAALDRTVRLYSLNENRILNSFETEDEADSIALSEEKEMIVVNDWNDAFHVFDLDLKHLNTDYFQYSHYAMDFSPDGKYLLAGYPVDPWISPLFKTDNLFKKHLSFPHADSMIYAVRFLNNSQAVLAGGTGNAIYFWDIETGDWFEMKGRGYGFEEIAFEDDSIYFINPEREPKDRLNYSFNLKTHLLAPSDYDSAGSSQGISTDYGQYSLTDGGYRAPDRLIIKKNGETINTIAAESPGYYHNVYSFTPDGDIISGQENGFLAVYRISGQEIARLIGHEGSISAMTLKGNLLITASRFQEIKLWDLSVLQNGGKIIHPFLSFYTDRDNEWILWSESGYYASSAEGDKCIGFHLNRQKESESLFYPSSRFQDIYNKPAFIRDVYRYKSEQKAFQYSEYAEEITEFNLEEILPPEIILESDFDDKSDLDSLNVRFSISNKSEVDITQVYVLVNGIRISENLLSSRSSRSEMDFSVNVPLTERENIITIAARNTFAESEPVYINIEKDIRFSDRKKPDLFLLAVGVSEYSDSSINLSYAALDAESVAMSMDAQKGAVYKTVQSRVLLNSQATREKILENLQWIKSVAGSDDTVLIFLAGHGTNDDQGNYYFLNHDTDLDDLASTAVPWTEFKKTVSGLAAKTVFILDTCHSGNIWGKMSEYQYSTQSAVKSLTGTSSGQIIITAATTDDSSFEGPEWEHGVFTYSMLEAIDEGLADYDGDGFISIKEMDFYISMRIKELTFGYQHPTTIIPDSIPDFAFASVY